MFVKRLATLYTINMFGHQTMFDCVWSPNISRLVTDLLANYNLRQYKMEQLSPIPQSNDESAKQRKTRHCGIIEMGGGEGVARCSIYFVQDCSSQGLSSRGRGRRERIEVLGMGLCFSSVLLQKIFPLTFWFPPQCCQSVVNTLPLEYVF